MDIAIDPLFKLTIGSHFFKINNPTPRAIQLLLIFCSKYVLMGYVRAPGNKTRLAPIKVFASRIVNNTEFRFHIGQYEDFKKMLYNNYIYEEMYETIVMPLYEPIKTNMLCKEGWILRDYQLEAKSFILAEDNTDYHSRMISMPTGTGKTVTALSACSEIGFRTVILILPTYIDKWCSDITSILNVKPKEISVIKGSGQLKGLIGLADDNLLTSKFIIISLSTIKNFYKEYELHGKNTILDEYGCLPDMLYEKLKVGTVLIDEVHQHLHGVFKSLIYTNVPKVIALSATLISDDHYVTKMQHLMFPKELRFDKVTMEKYIKVRALAYQFEDFAKSKIKTTTYPRNTYSHVEFEKSIMRNKTLLNKYLNMINYLINISYINEYMPSDKLVIYAASIAMCNEILNYIKQRHSRFNIKRYVEEDPYDNIINSDIAVTTMLSAGTAIDIPNLRSVIMTTNIQSPVSNLQVLGRLRKLKDRDVKFYYLYCEQIPKQVDYHHKKMELFESKSASIKEFKYPNLL